MKKLIAILTASCLALASAQAAKPEEANKKPADKPKAQKQQAAPKQQPAPKPQAAPKQQAAPKIERSADAPRTTAPKKEKRIIPEVESKKAATVKPEKIQSEKPRLETKPAQTTDLSPKKAPLDKATVQRIQKQHTNFQAKPNTLISSVQFNPNYRIEGAQNLSGPQYEVFRSYQPQWHDQTYWRSRYSDNLRLIAGGWYYWDAGYWYPAWGYDDAADYYPYDGPIYVGSNPRPFDQVVADVQAVLQEQGFYRGEVDGLVGPLTREALAAYQATQGLPPTAAIDQPTLDSLGLS